MTDPSTPDTRLAGRTVRRRLATLAAAAITGAAFAPALAVSAAGADPESACGTFTFGADASADLLRLRTLDLNPLAVPEFKPVSEITVASTTASSSGGAEGRSDARAKYLAGKLLGVDVPAGPLAAEAHQAAPPVAADGVTVAGPAITLGALSIGSGSLTARTTWPAAPRCKPAPGDLAKAGAAVVDATILPALDNGALVRLQETTSSAATTSLNGARQPVATATTGLADIRLLAGTAGEIKVKVLHAPQLKATAAGSTSASSVEYTAPVLEVTLPGGHVERIESAHKTIDIPVPVNGGPAAESGPAAAAPSSSGPAAKALTGPATPMRKLLDNLPAAAKSATSRVGGRSGVGQGAADAAAAATKTATPKGTSDLPGVSAITDAVPALPGVGSLPDVPGVGSAPAAGALAAPAETESKAKPAAAAAPADKATIRLSIGDLVKEITDEKVHAAAPSLRIQVLANGKPAGDGYGGAAAGQTVLDLGVGVLETTAQLPPGSGGEISGGGSGAGGEAPGDSGGTGGTGGGSAGPTGGTGGGSGLPVTGPGVALLAGGATVLVLVGRLLMVLARRRNLIG